MARLSICLSVLFLGVGCSALPHLRSALHSGLNYATESPVPVVAMEKGDTVNWLPWAIGAGAALAGAGAGGGAMAMKKKNGV